MRKGGMWRMCCQQADNRWEKLKVDWKGDGEEAGGWSVQSMVARAEGQGDDSLNNESCWMELAKLRQCAVEHGKKEMAVEYGGREVSGTSIDEPEVGNIFGSRGGIFCIVHDGYGIPELEESSRVEKELGNLWWWLVCKELQRRMAAPSFRPEGRRWGGCHCRRCMGAGQQESRGKEVEEIQSGTEGNLSLAEQCFIAKNSAEEC